MLCWFVFLFEASCCFSRIKIKFQNMILVTILVYIFLHTQQCHTTIWQCQIFFRPALSDRRKIPWQWCWFVTSIDVYIFTTNHGASYGSFGLCKVTARWPDLTHLSVHSLVNGVRSTRTSFLVRVIGSTATTVRKVSEVTKEMKLHDYD